MPKQASLPTLEDRKIEELQSTATEYAEIRDRRQELTKHEVELKSKLLRLMKEHKKDTYEYDGVEVTIVVEEETVKVRVKKQQKESDEPGEETAESEEDSATASDPDGDDPDDATFINTRNKGRRRKGTASGG